MKNKKLANRHWGVRKRGGEEEHTWEAAAEMVRQVMRTNLGGNPMGAGAVTCEVSPGCVLRSTD